MPPIPRRRWLVRATVCTANRCRERALAGRTLRPSRRPSQVKEVQQLASVAYAVGSSAPTPGTGPPPLALLTLILTNRQEIALLCGQKLSTQLGLRSTWQAADVGAKNLDLPNY